MTLVQKVMCCVDNTAMHDGVGRAPVSLCIAHSCHVVEYLSSILDTGRYCYLLFSVCKKIYNWWLLCGVVAAGVPAYHTQCFLDQGLTASDVAGHTLLHGL